MNLIDHPESFDVLITHLSLDDLIDLYSSTKRLQEIFNSERTLNILKYRFGIQDNVLTFGELIRAYNTYYLTSRCNDIYSLKVCLQWAAKLGDIDSMRKTVGKYAGSNQLIWDMPAAQTTAAEYGQTEILVELLKIREDPNYAETFLIRAIKNGHFETMNYLLDRYPGYIHSPRLSLYAYYYGLISDDYSLYDNIIDRGGIVPTVSNLLRTGAIDNNKVLVDRAIKSGVTNNELRLAVNLARERGNIEMVEYLGQYV